MLRSAALNDCNSHFHDVNINQSVAWCRPCHESAPPKTIHNACSCCQQLGLDCAKGSPYKYPCTACSSAVPPPHLEEALLQHIIVNKRLALLLHLAGRHAVQQRHVGAAAILAAARGVEESKGVHGVVHKACGRSGRGGACVVGGGLRAMG
jgi:hypothetical protein